MLKKLLLMASTLAVIVVLFFVYHLATGGAGPQKQDDLGELVAALNTDLPEGDARPFEEEKTLTIEGMPLRGGKKAWVTLYDPRTRRERLQFRATTWEPLGDNELHLEEMEVRLLMPGGQLAEIHANEGQILLTSRDLSRAEARRGWIKGNVQIYVDRTSAEWRAANPDRADMADHPERVVRIWMDELEFDLELARLETDGEFRVQSVEADLEGVGLKLRWNEDQNRIEHLEIAEGKQMLVRGRPREMRFTLPGSDGEMLLAQTDEPEETAAPAEPQSPVVPAPAVEEDDDPELLRLTDEPKRKPQAAGAYRATFDRNVVVEDRNGLELRGGLTADQLLLTFDYRQAREVAESSSREREHDEPGDPQQDQSRLVVTWSGPLTVSPTDPIEGPDDKQKFHVEATGNPVRLRDGDSLAECDRLVFHNETQSAWLHGTDDRLVQITSGDGRTMSARLLHYDRPNARIRMTGRGTMTASGAGVRLLEADQSEAAQIEAELRGHDNRLTRISWTRSVDLEMDEQEFTVTDPETGAPRPRRSQYIRAATLEGGVEFAQDDQLVQADHVYVDFGVPRRPGRVIDYVERFEGRGGVRLIPRAREEVRCERMEIDMALADDGRNVPTEARAFGDVRAAQRGRQIEAAESMRVTLGDVPAPLPPVDLAQARSVAASRGIDPDKVDWDAWQTKRAARMETAILALEARRDVRIRDDENGLHVRADDLVCTIPDGKQIDQAIVQSADGRWAEVVTDEFKIRGNRIRMEAERQWVHVPGDGEVEFYTDQDLDGRALDKPVPVLISWEGQMELHGRQNRLQFDQRVQAVSSDGPDEQHRMICDKLTVSFVNMPPRDVPQETRSPQSTYWVFAPLVRQLGGRDDEPRSASLRFNKRPVTVYAEGQVVALSSTHEPRTRALLTRVRISGPRIIVDLRRQTTNVEGAGNLLAEDYRMRAPAPRTTAPDADPLLAQIGGSGPSQTLFAWANSMSYLQNRDMAILDQEVQMVHRAGSDMVLGGAVAAAHNVDIGKLRTISGRTTTLDCNNLVVEFDRATSAQGRNGSLFGGGQLRRFEAAQAVLLKDVDKTLVGDRLTYSTDTGLVTVSADGGREAHIYDESAETATLRGHWRGPELRWNRRTNRIEARDATMIYSRQ